MPPASVSAVFLSYASQDTDAARRLCEALRTAGIEVWFDQSELVGGDAWDQKIRSQIKSCALFVPLISANTQARLEGYFRLEWKLAAQRTHTMADAKPFLLPVVIDATRDAEAHVPEEFRAVQWTRLPAGETSGAFCARVQQLLGGSLTEPRRPRSGERDEGAAFPSPAPAKVGRRVPAAAWLAGGIAALLGTAAVFWPKGTAPSPGAARMEAPTSRATATVPDPVAIDPKAVAVLPFQNLTAAADSAGFTAGMHGEILIAVGKVSALKVIGSTSVLPYADPSKRNLRQIASTLGVGSVVQGSVSRAGNSVRIAVELIDTQTARLLWADSFTRDLTDMFAIQSAIAQEVAARLNVTLTPGERTLLDRRPTRNTHAYELFLRAQQLNNDLVANSPIANWEHVVHLLDEAVAADPDFVPALALLARTHASMHWFPSLDPSPARRERAQAALTALRRLALAAPETEFALGAFYFCCDLNFGEALRHFEAALPGMPNDSTLHRLTGFVKFQLGRFDDGIASGLRAVELNPLELQNTIDLVIYYSMLRRYPAAVAAGDRANALARAGMGPSLGAAGGMVELARFAIDNDLGGLVRRLRSLPARPFDPSGLLRDYECAMLEGDLPAAARHLANPQLDGLYSPLGPAGGPVALHRAYVARLRGQSATAVEEARKATAQLRAMTPIPRQRPYVAVQLARAAACAGAIGEARRLADELRRELPAIILMDRLAVLSELARTYALMDAREEALDCLRTLMTGPIIAGNAATYCSPNAIRIDPCWSRLKTDPRFEEILQSAKSL